MDVAESTCSSADGLVGCFQCGANMKLLKEGLPFKPVHRHACLLLWWWNVSHLVQTHLIFFFFWMTASYIPGWPQTCHVAENDLELCLKFSFNITVFVCMMYVSEHVWRSEDRSMELVLPPLHGFQAQVCSARTFTHRPQTLNFWSSCFYLLGVTPGWQVVPLWLVFAEPGTEPWYLHAGQALSQIYFTSKKWKCLFNSMFTIFYWVIFLLLKFESSLYKKDLQQPPQALYCK